MVRTHSPKPVVLTIGNFDGVHLGHLAVLKRVREVAQHAHCPCVAFTFENHPSTVLRPNQPVSLLCTPAHKLRLLEQAQVDRVISAKFTTEFAQHTAQEFLTQMQVDVPFSHLILGHDALLGKDRKGNRQQVEAITKALHVSVEYLDPFQIEGITVSSSYIRTLIQQGNFTRAAQFLGRPFSIYAPVISGGAKGKAIGFPTANIEVTGLCLPPLGVYAVRLIYQNKSLDAVANLGMAPTVRHDNKPLLEIHILDQSLDLYGQFVEVVFFQYIRSEQKFPSLQHLQAQIQHDVTSARHILKAHNGR